MGRRERRWPRVGCGVWAVTDSRKGHADDSEKSIEDDGHYGLLLECFFIGLATYESFKHVAPNEIYA